jgi:hypothetical protein
MASKSSERPASYQILLVGLLSLNFGIVFFDRNSLNFLMPFVKPELGLTNEQVGIFQSALSLTWALAAAATSRPGLQGADCALILPATQGHCKIVTEGDDAYRNRPTGIFRRCALVLAWTGAARRHRPVAGLGREDDCAHRRQHQ